MADEHAPASPEVAHVLFIDIVGYSKESTTIQIRLIRELNELVGNSETFRSAREGHKVLSLPTGDGMALLFFDDVFAPARCAKEISLANSPARVRMGIHSGLVQHQIDITGAENAVGEGINTAARIMDAGEAGHILLSEQYAGWLRQFDEWAPLVHELGTTVAKHDQRLKVFSLFGSGFGRAEGPKKLEAGGAARSPDSLNVVIVYRRKTEPDDHVLAVLERELRERGHDVFVDRHLKIGVEWAKAIEERIRSADAVVAILSDSAAGSEMLEYEIETAFEENRHKGKPLLLPVRVGTDSPVAGSMGGFLNRLHFTIWLSHDDDARVVEELVAAMTAPEEVSDELVLEPVGGAVPSDSPFYVERPSDAEFATALKANESILLVKGPRQAGKTSLIGRGAAQAARLGWRSVVTDFQKLSSSHLGSDDALYRLLAALLAKQLRFTYDFESEWLDVFGANMNLDNFVRALLEASPEPFVWFMDEADKLFGVPFASDFFGLVRSWHNSRATEPGGPWGRLTVVIAYATEAHLFIQDLNQSPFNVGRQLPLSNFTVEQVADLNTRYGKPLGAEEVRRLWQLVGGQPFLTRRALDILALRAMPFSEMLALAASDEGPFGDHLRRILISVSQLPDVMEALRASITNPEVKESEAVHRLVSAGVVRQVGGNRLELMCELYRIYLAAHLGSA
ncbi:MAG TPA: AAA-like domain-containing protein [Fimbriimonadaceae bacterium]|nr:AAA-like domain-containing protein [Fimbriimonadaceae bacterium]